MKGTSKRKDLNFSGASHSALDSQNDDDDDALVMLSQEKKERTSDRPLNFGKQ